MFTRMRMRYTHTWDLAWVDTSTQSDAEETSVLCIYVRILRKRLPLF